MSARWPKPVIRWRNPEVAPEPAIPRPPPAVGEVAPAKDRRAWRYLVPACLLGLAVLTGGAALASWSSSAPGPGASAAQFVNQGNQPAVDATGSSVTVSWVASTLSGGNAVSGYLVHRYDTNDVPQVVGPACDGTITVLLCTEVNVPNGTWKYSITPVFTSWSGVESAKTSVTVAAPTVTATNPSSRGQGATNQDIAVTGTNFQSGATVSFSGPGITVNSTTFNSSTQLTANITIAGGAAVGARNVTVTNPDTSAASCSACFTVNAGPTVTATNPSSRAQGATNQDITVSGTNFQTGASASFSGSGITVNSTTFNSSTQLTVNITIAAGATPGPRNVTVTNPDAGTGSCTGCFAVLSTTALTVSAPATGTVGTEIPANSITATLSGGTSSPQASGSITFTVFGPQAAAPSVCTTGGTAVGSAVTVNGNGSYGASAGFTPSAAGTYWWYASYSGDAFNTASNTACPPTVSTTVTDATLQYVATGTVSTRTSSGSITVQYPAGTSTNDLLFLVQANAANQNITTPAGWTLLADQATGTPAQFRFTVWWRLAGGETSVTHNVNTNGSGTSEWVIRYRRPTGYPPNPSLATATVRQGISGATATMTPSPDVTTNQANATVISIAAIRAANPLSLNTAQGFALQNATTSTPNVGVGLGIADRVVAPSGSTPASPTWSQTGTPAQWAWMTVAFA